jgi:hypothetical protein
MRLSGRRRWANLLSLLSLLFLELLKLGGKLLALSIGPYGL